MFCVQGFTPLRVAASEGHKQVTELLLEHGADINSQDDDVCLLIEPAVLMRSSCIDLTDFVVYDCLACKL